MVNLWRVSSISSAPLLDLGRTSNDDMGHDTSSREVSGYDSVNIDTNDFILLLLLLMSNRRMITISYYLIVIGETLYSIALFE